MGLEQAWDFLKNQKSPFVGPNRDHIQDTADMAGTIGCDNPGCTNPATPTTVRWNAKGHRYCNDCVRGNIHRIVADNPGAADARHCQSQGCQAMVKPGNSYCAACLERGDATDTQGIDPEGNYGNERNQ